MDREILNIDTLLAIEGDFLLQFDFNEGKIREDYVRWSSTNEDKLVRDYFFYLINQCSLFITKAAETEDEFYKIQLKLNLKRLQYTFEEERILELRRQIHINKLMISQVNLPFSFSVRIESGECCSYCARRSKKIYPLESILKKQYIPFVNCKSATGCICSYLIIPEFGESKDS